MIEHFPLDFSSTPVREGYSDYNMTAATGYCSYIVLAQIYYIQHHPDRHTPTPDCSTLSPETLQFVLDQLKSLSHIVEDLSSHWLIILANYGISFSLAALPPC
jgi:hypothetical protein